MVYRLPEERATNSDKLSLDRKHLTVCPILEGEEKLRLLNMQHNAITKLQHLSNLRRLVFLDLYDNLIHEVTALEGLLSLRVLMLGRNRYVLEIQLHVCVCVYTVDDANMLQCMYLYMCITSGFERLLDYRPY